jgi:hypothetical protein
MYIRISGYLCIRVSMYVCIHYISRHLALVSLLAKAWILFLHACCTYICAYVYSRLFMCVYIRIYTYIYVYILKFIPARLAGQVEAKTASYHITNNQN